MIESNMTNLWAQYGLSSSPYFINPLDSIKTSLYPISLFVGRQNEIKIMLDRIASNDSSRIIIEGLSGVGKTTFIHYIKYIAGKKNQYLTFYDHIRITEDYTSTQFIIDTIHNTLLALYQNYPERIEEFDEDRVIQTAKRLIMETKDRQWGLGLNFFGTGGNVSKETTRVLPIYQPQQFHSLLEELSTTIGSFGFEGIIIHINNIENLCLANPEIARRFFNNIRDFLMIPGYHYIIGARLGFTEEILGKDDRVRSIFPLPIILEPLNIENTINLLKKRYKHLRVGNKKYIPPVEEEIIINYHKMFQGDLRSMFSTICDAIELRGHQLEPKSLSYELINPILQKKYEQYLKNKFSDPAWQILQKLKEKESTFRQTELINKDIGLTQGRISQIFNELELKKGIRCVNNRGRSKFYDLSGISKIALDRVV